MKKIFTLIAFVTINFLLTGYVYGQEKIGSISGTVQSADGKLLDGATITLARAKDNGLVKAAVTDKAGYFEIEKIANGKYIVTITAVGFTKFTTPPFEVDATNNKVALGTLQLNTAEKNLGTVQVTTTRPLIENKIDKTVVNVDAAVTNVGTTAMDVLEKSPGISVDKDGNISLKGKQGVIILMDGKPSYLSGADLANLLRNTPSGQLDQIEIMSQPSAKFDASGNSGVINIKTKRNTQKGFNGSISSTYTQGFYARSSNSFNISSRKNKVSVFANYNYSYFEGFNETTIYRKFHNQQTKDLTGIFDQTTNLHYIGRPHTLKAGMDFFATKKTTLGFVLNGTYMARGNTSESRTNILNSGGGLDSINTADNDMKDPWRNYSANVNFRHVFDSTGTEVTADLDYVRYITKTQQNSNNYTFNPVSSRTATSYLLRGNLPSDINIYSAKVDFAKPLKKNARLEAGLKTSYVETDNDARYTFWDGPNNKWSIDKKSNHFVYKENINAAYINANKQMKKWGVQLGLRLENTISKGNQLTNGRTFDRNYTQLFPTSYISYKYNANNNFGLSYGRRIDRPNYQDMNPFQRFLDQYTYREGNPYLTPQFTHNIELSHNYKGELNTSVNYTYTTDIINDVLIQNDTTKVTFQTKRNIAKRRNIGLSISYNKAITKVWTVSAFGNAFNNYFEGYIDNASLKTDYTSFMVNVNNQFRFKKGWSAELSGFYRSKTLEAGTIVAEPMGMFSFGASKQVLKNKGTVRMSVRDPFLLQKFRGYTRFSNIDATIHNTWDNRAVSLALIYRFGKNQNNIPVRKRTSASQEEQNRVGQGGNQ